MANKLTLTHFVDNLLLFIFLGTGINNSLGDLLEYMLLALSKQAALLIAFLEQFSV